MGEPDVFSPDEAIDAMPGLAGWVSELRIAAGTLLRAPAGSIGSISLTARMMNVPGEKTLLSAVTERCAALYGLVATISIKGDWFTVRFSPRAD